MAHRRLGRVCLGMSVSMILVALPVTSAVASTHGHGDTMVGGNPSPSPLAPFVHPSSQQTAAIARLWWVIFGESMFVLAVIVVLLVINFVRFRARADDTEEGEQIFGNKKLEITWIAIPGFLLLAAYIGSIVTMLAVDTTTAAASDRIRVVVTGHQWWWQFRYPAQRIVTADVMHIPMGKTTVVDITSADVLHSFYIPELSRQITAIPNVTTTVYITPQRPGIYGGACYEFCGQGHAWMEFQVVVDRPEQFARWAAHERQPPARPTTRSEALGQSLFMSLACVSCHTISGTNAKGGVGPPLSHVASRSIIAGGALAMSKENLQRWISNPGKYKNGARMPGFDLIGEKKVKQLADYLWTQK